MTTTTRIESSPMDAGAVQALVFEFASSPEHAWSIGVAGAIAEFMYDADEVVRLDTREGRVQAVTARGRLDLRLDRPLTCRITEEASACAPTGIRKVEFLLPAAAASYPARETLTELPAADSACGPLFELGLGTRAVQFCVRAEDPALAARLRAAAGRNVFAPDNLVLHDILHAAPPRVVRSALGSIEVYGPIPAQSERSPAGPHTHLLPRLLGTEPESEAIVALTLYPAHPLRDKYGRNRAYDSHAEALYQDLVERVRAA